MLEPIIDFLLEHEVILGLVVIAVGYLLFLVKNILIICFVSYILMASLLPFVTALHRRKIPKVLAATLIYLFMISLFLVLVVPLVPFFAQQIQLLATSFPGYLKDATKLLHMKIDYTQLNNYIGSKAADIGQNAFLVTGKFFEIVFTFITVIIISFYLIIDYDRIRHEMAHLFPKAHRQKVTETLTQIEDKMGAWLRGQIILSFSLGLFTWLAYTLVGMKYALPLALVTGIMELIPTIGPILGAIPAIIIAMTISSTMAITVLTVYIITHVLESHILVPKIMQRAVGLHPIIVIIGILVGGELMGIKGALLSLPFISLLAVIFKNVEA